LSSISCSIGAVWLETPQDGKLAFDQGRTIWIADAHRDDGKRFVVRTDELLTAFVETEIDDSSH